ncbi:NAD(+) diphosphatase [Anianabacter salinae]|uniref:NAD(+) diphosphatase n=1 Tax=Anianabacter salinae TaxID=2851023 RepID=UPI00225E1087|nr:NAD(+) diphosphatase [Anianabacter salinae]MBV0910792.1 NAD(+) diphosphatase [Anianabacter salinae]
MRIAETVTFGGSGLDRAAELRGDPEQIDAARRDPGTRWLPVWRGKPLMRQADEAAGGWIAAGHSLIAESGGPEVFLGRDSGAPRFAVDVSAWEPEALPDTLGAFFDPSEQRHPDLPDDMAFAELRGAMTRLTPREAELLATARATLGWHATHRFCARCGGESVAAQGGWQRDCPACGGHHFPRTDPVVIMLITRGNSVLLGRSPGWPDGMYSLLAGFVEPGETIEAAVRREVMEEAGIKVGAVSYLASQPWPFPSSLMLGCAGEALSSAITVDPVELEDALWLSREEVAACQAGNDDRIKPARKGAIAHFLLSNWLADKLR